jgi:hypothetical protein
MTAATKRYRWTPRNINKLKKLIKVDGLNYDDAARELGTSGQSVRLAYYRYVTKTVGTRGPRKIKSAPEQLDVFYSAPTGAPDDSHAFESHSDEGEFLDIKDSKTATAITIGFVASTVLWGIISLITYVLVRGQ